LHMADILVRRSIVRKCTCKVTAKVRRTDFTETVEEILLRAKKPKKMCTPTSYQSMKTRLSNLIQTLITFANT